MQAVILAAGMGSRLGGLNGGRPKCLTEIGGRALILHQLEMLADHGIGPILCVLGHGADAVREVVGDRAEFVLNPRYAETNSLYSLWLAREWIRGPFVLVNSDLLFDPAILDRVLDAHGSALAYDSTSSRGREQTKVVVRKGQVTDLGKDLAGDVTQGESLGLLKFDEEGSRVLLEVVDQLVKDGRENEWSVAATRAMCGRVRLHAVNIAGRPWAEIDFPHDLDVARREVWPAIWKGRWRRQVLWRRTRWAAVGALALTLAAFGWQANSRVGPASIDWDTVPLAGGQMVRIERLGGPERWWSVARGETALAQVSGPDVRVELRLVLPEQATPRARFVVALSVDGRLHDWEALTATPDTSHHLAGAALGDRDRVSLHLAPGTHEVGVRLVEGHGDRVLVRVRHREHP